MGPTSVMWLHVTVGFPSTIMPSPTTSQLARKGFRKESAPLNYCACSPRRKTVHLHVMSYTWEAEPRTGWLRSWCCWFGRTASRCVRCTLAHLIVAPRNREGSRAPRQRRVGWVAYIRWGPTRDLPRINGVLAVFMIIRQRSRKLTPSLSQKSLRFTLSDISHCPTSKLGKPLQRSRWSIATETLQTSQFGRKRYS